MKTFLKLAQAIFIIMLQYHTAAAADGRISMNFDLSMQPADRVTRLWVPYPVSDKYQLISNINIRGDCTSYAVYTDRKFKNPILYAEWSKGIRERHLALSFDIHRMERNNRPLHHTSVQINPQEFGEYLKGSALAPVSGAVAKLASEIIGDRKGIVDRAKAIYDWVCKNMHRDPDTAGCGKGDVCMLLRHGLGGKCADIHSVFVALLRAAGVPAREVFGLRLPKEVTADITAWQHCWAEFYLPGHGWIAADPGDVIKACMKENLAFNNPKALRYRDYFFGAVDAFRLSLTTGRDIRLNPPQQGPDINYFMYPFAQAGSKTLDWLRPERFKYTIRYTPLPGQQVSACQQLRHIEEQEVFIHK